MMWSDLTIKLITRTNQINMERQTDKTVFLKEKNQYAESKNFVVLNHTH